MIGDSLAVPEVDFSLEEISLGDYMEIKKKELILKRLEINPPFVFSFDVFVKAKSLRADAVQKTSNENLSPKCKAYAGLQ